MSVEIKHMNIIKLFWFKLLVEFIDQLCCLNTALIAKWVVHNTDHRKTSPSIAKNTKPDIGYSFSNVFVGLGSRR